jgi:succinoglycan biosynthesis protein ExoU
LLRLRDCDDGLASIRPLRADEQRALRRHWNSVDCRLQWRRLISAVKNRDVGAAVSTFRSPEAAAFLAARLGEQAWLRSTAFARTDAASRGA